MNFDFLPFRIKFIKTKLCNYGRYLDFAQVGDTFNGIIDLEDIGGTNSTFISLYNNNPKFCKGTSPATEGNNIHKMPYVYSFLYISFNGSNFAKETIERANTKEKVFNYLIKMFKNHGYEIIKEKKQSFEDIEL